MKTKAYLRGVVAIGHHCWLLYIIYCTTIEAFLIKEKKTHKFLAVVQ